MSDRLQQLRDEFQKGQEQMARLEHQRQELRDTLLRISGAIRVLEELMEGTKQPAPDNKAYSQVA